MTRFPHEPHRPPTSADDALRLPRPPDANIEEDSLEFEDFEDGDPVIKDPDAWDDDAWDWEHD